MSDTDDQGIAAASGRSALEKFIFGIEDQPSDGMSDGDNSNADDTVLVLEDEVAQEPIIEKETTTSLRKSKTQDILRHAIDLHEQGALEKAEWVYGLLLRDFPGIATAWINLGIVLRQRRKIEASIVCLRRGLALRPDDVTAWSSLGNALRDSGRYEEAIRAHRHALDLNPGAAQVHYNLGLVHRDLGQLKEAATCFRRAKLLGYDSPILRLDQSRLDLLAGDFDAGFNGYEARWQVGYRKPRFPDTPIWEGENLREKVLLVYVESGINDALQFSRYVPRLRAYAGTVIFQVQSELKKLFESSSAFNDINIVSEEDTLSNDIGAVIPLMSLPRIFGVDFDLQPDPNNDQGAYLSQPKTDVSVISAKNTGLLRIGLCWARADENAKKSSEAIGLEHFTKLLDLPNTRIYSFQLGARREDISSLSFEPVIRDLSRYMKDYADIAGLMQNIDLVITADTSIAHLAGAMGKSVWVLLPFAPNWRWQLVRGDCPWYPTMSLIRQTSAGDWQEVMHRVRKRVLDELHQKKVLS